MSTLLEKSQTTKNQADRILQESGLITILSRVGNPKITGSYALDVMLRPDLDIYTIIDSFNKENFLELMHDIFELNYFAKISYENWREYYDELYTQGNPIRADYIQLVKKIYNTLWKLDIYLLTENQYKPLTEEFTELLKGSDSEVKKLIILELKEKYFDGKKYRDGINGKFIYEAVLKNNVSTTDEFEEFIKNKK